MGAETIYTGPLLVMKLLEEQTNGDHSFNLFDFSELPRTLFRNAGTRFCHITLDIMQRYGISWDNGNIVHCMFPGSTT